MTVKTLTTAKEQKIPLIFTRFIYFLSGLAHNRRGMLGMAILVISTSIALTANLLTPYDPVWETYIARDYAVPIWFRHLPGGGNLSENVEPIAQPSFSTPNSLEEWNFTETSSSATIELRYDPVIGAKDYGSAAIHFRRAKEEGYSGKVKATLAKRFFYPYNGPPGIFKASIAVLTEGAEHLEEISIKVFFRRLEENATKSYLLWNEIISKDRGYWTTPSTPIDSYASKEWVVRYFEDSMVDPAKIVFNATTYYEYAVEIGFLDSKPGMLNKDVEVIVHIDDLDANLYGYAFGLLGTDYRGRDIFTQLIYGARISLLVGFLSAIISVGIGLLVGLVAGYLGGITDEAIMRFTDMLLVIPGLPLLIVLIAVFKEAFQQPTYLTIIILLGILGWMGFARVVRSQVLSLKERPFVEAAKAVGAGKLHIIARHVLPNVMSLVYVSLALSVPSAILSEAALSWLGLYDPNVMSWGRMLFDIQTNHGVERWWWVLPPGLSIAIVSLSFILLGYALDEILNPKLRRRR